MKTHRSPLETLEHAVNHGMVIINKPESSETVYEITFRKSSNPFSWVSNKCAFRDHICRDDKYHYLIFGIIIDKVYITKSHLKELGRDKAVELERLSGLSEAYRLSHPKGKKEDVPVR